MKNDPHNPQRRPPGAPQAPYPRRTREAGLWKDEMDMTPAEIFAAMFLAGACVFAAFWWTGLAAEADPDGWVSKALMMLMLLSLGLVFVGFVGSLVTL